MVLTRGIKRFDDPGQGSVANLEEIVIGENRFRLYLLGVTFRGDDATAERDTVRIGIDAPRGGKVTRVNSVADTQSELLLPAETRRYEMTLGLDDSVYFHCPEFGSEGVLAIVAKIVHRSQVRFGFEASRWIPIHRLEIYLAINKGRRNAAVPLTTERASPEREVTP